MESLQVAVQTTIAICPIFSTLLYLTSRIAIFQSPGLALPLLGFFAGFATTLYMHHFRNFRRSLSPIQQMMLRRHPLPLPPITASVMQLVPFFAGIAANYLVRNSADPMLRLCCAVLMCESVPKLYSGARELREHWYAMHREHFYDMRDQQFAMKGRLGKMGTLKEAEAELETMAPKIMGDTIIRARR